MTAKQARPVCLAISAAFKKVLSYNLFRKIYLIATSFDNDTQGCYNRTIPPHVMLCYRRLSLPKNAAKMLTLILNNTIYKIKTGHGVAARTYLLTVLCRIFGVGEGRCAASAICTAILNTIIWSVSAKYTAMEITSPIEKKTYRLVDAYVDDTVLIETSSHQERDI